LAGNPERDWLESSPAFTAGGRMTQISLLAPRFPRARATDARSSHTAAAEIERKGIDKLQAQAVLAAMRRYDNVTSMELATWAGLDRYAVARRLSELASDGLVTRVEPTADTVPCVVSGKKVLRWRVR
jgi:CRP-like cAMP-binding protein